MRVYIYTLLIALYVTSQFISDPIIDYSIGIMAMIALLSSVFYARGVYFISGAIFFIVGTILFLYNRLPWYTFVLHFRQVLGLLSLFFRITVYELLNSCRPL